MQFLNPINKPKNIMLLLVLFLCLNSLSPAETITDTGSFGPFAPRHLLDKEDPWQVFRFVGTTTKSNFPCDSNGGSCAVTKDYTAQFVVPDEQDRVMTAGRHSDLYKVERRYNGTFRFVDIKSMSNPSFAVISDQINTSRLGFDGAEVSTVQRRPSLTKLFGEDMSSIGHVESKAAAYSNRNPHSFYYHVDDGGRPSWGDTDKESQFGLTVVEDLMLAGQVSNWFKSRPQQENLRSATTWCHSDNWRLNNDFVATFLKADYFDMEGCQDEKLITSRTSRSVSELAANFFFNRVDSDVTLHFLDDFTYRATANREFVCPFDCDGTSYGVEIDGRKKILITTDRRTFTSSTKFKIKIVMIDWDNDGFQLESGEKIGPHSNLDLRRIKNDPVARKDIVAVIVSEIKDTQSFNVSSGNGTYTQKTVIAFPPRPREGYIPPDEEARLSKYTNDSANRELLYSFKLLDAVFAMLPDQVQTSPELADAEEKLDEARLWLYLKMEKARATLIDTYGNDGDARIISTDLLFDIKSEVDATTAPSWGNPERRGRLKTGKIEWLLDQMQ